MYDWKENVVSLVAVNDSFPFGSYIIVGMYIIQCGLYCVESIFSSITFLYCVLIPAHSRLIRSVLEYASPVWANLPEYLSLLIEGVQKKALEIIFPGLPYRDALVHCGLRALSDRRAVACIKFIQRVRDTGVLVNLLAQRTTVLHGYNLCSGTIREDPAMAANNRLNKFITYRYS